MATINPTISETSQGKGNPYMLLAWTTVTDADTAASIDMRDYIRRVSRDATPTDMIVYATSGGASGFDGNTLTVEQSLDGTNWYTAKDPADADATLSAAGAVAVRDWAPHMRFTFSGVGTAQDVDIWLRLAFSRH